MKRQILTTLSAIALTIGTSYGQCSFTGLNATYCVNDASSNLTPSGAGTFSGTGVSGTTFDPAVAGIGMHNVNYIEGDVNLYTVDQTGTFNPIASPISGTTVALGDDQVSTTLPIGFNFYFYGVMYTDFYIGSNGFLTFNSGMPSGCCSGGLLPTNTTPNNMIAFAWEDLDRGYVGAPAINLIQYTTIGTAPFRTLVVEFYNVDHYPSGNNVTTQVHLFETTNIIEIHTTTQPDAVQTHTMGIQNNGGTIGIAVPGRNAAAWAVTNDYVAFLPDACYYTETTEVLALPTVTANADFTTICDGDMVTFTGGGADSYAWDNSVTDGVAIAVTSAATTFNVVGTDLNGCDNTAMVSITVNALPTVTGMVDVSPVCEGDTVIFTGGGADSYVWDNGVTDGANFIASTSGAFTVTGTELVNGCSNTATVNLVVNTAPSIVLTPNDEMTGNDGGVTSMITGTGPYTYDWDNDGTGDFDDPADLTGLVAGTYNVTVMDANGCSGNGSAIVGSQVGIEGVDEITFSIFPNPTNGLLNLNFNSGLAIENITIQVINSLGQVIITQKLTSTTQSIDLSKEEAGVYFIKVSSDNSVQEVRVVKQ